MSPRPRAKVRSVSNRSNRESRRQNTQPKPGAFDTFLRFRPAEFPAPKAKEEFMAHSTFRKTAQLSLSARYWHGFVGLAVLAATVAACGLYGIEPPDNVRTSSPRPGDQPEIGQAVLHIAAVPDDVACVRITAAGPSRTVTREIDVNGAAALSESLSGLPLGTVVFTGEAFAGKCSAVSKSTIAGWASDPVSVSIVLGRLSNVDLVMTRNGRAKVDVNFADEAACTPLGAACRIASECCSKRCLGAVCVVADAGVMRD
jgi:hypothetical protein